VVRVIHIEIDSTRALEFDGESARMKGTRGFPSETGSLVIDLFSPHKKSLHHSNNVLPKLRSCG